jgi:hypothetical protein
MTREQQFAAIEKARDGILSWAHERGVPLARVEYVVPFVEDDFSLSVWLFYDRDVSVASYEADGTTKALKERYLKMLCEIGYAERWLSEVAFYLDSHEHVVRDYQGSYFYRLR